MSYIDSYRFLFAKRTVGLLTMTGLNLIIKKGLLFIFSVLLVASSVVHSSNDNTIQFKRGGYSTLTESQSLLTDTHQSIKSQMVNTQRQYTIIQFENLPSDLEKAALVEQGIELLEYISDKAYWAKLNKVPQANTKSKTKGHIQQTQVFKLWMPPNEIKVSVELDKAIKNGRTGLFQVIAVFHKGISKSSIEKKLFDNGVLSEINWVGDVTSKISTDLKGLKNIIRFDELKWIEQQAPETVIDNANAAQRIKVNQITSAPLSLTGQGITIGVWDSGRVDFHSDYNDRVTILTNRSVSRHTTRITGMAIGSGAGDTAAMGMAPQAKVRNWSFNDLNYENDVISEAQNNRIDLANFSFSTSLGWSSNGVDRRGADSLFGFYSAQTSVYDSIVYDHGLLIFKVAGNSRDDCNISDPADCDGDDQGFDSIPHRSIAKNIVTLGATDDDDNISVFTGWGPADDGRIKPDLCANGTSIYTTTLNNTYATTSGTSFSTPSASGAAALLLEHYSNLYDELPNDPALIKGIMIHSAAEFGKNPGPDPMCGWGVINAENAAQLISQEAFIIGSATQGEDLEVATISVPDNTSQVKVTLAWTDPAGNPSASIALVNNLDLRLIDSDNKEYFPWRLDSNNGFRTATKGDNSRDNIEQITIDNPSSGRYTIRILAGDIPSGPQNYVLISEFVGNSVSTQTSEICFPLKNTSGALAIVCL